MNPILQKLDEQLKNLDPQCIKAVGIDVDGTLINEEQICTPKTEATIKKVLESGREVFLVTGRSVAKTINYAKQIGIPKFMVNHNGCVVWNMQENKKEFDLRINEEVAKGLIQIVRDQKLFSVIHSDDIVYAEIFQEELIDFDTLDAASFHKFIISVSVEGTQPLVDLINSKYGEELHIMQTRSNLANPNGNKHCLEIINKDANKGATLAKVLSMVGVKLEETVAFGDDGNDLEMLIMVKYGVAMGNGRDFVRATAPYTTISNDEDGVASFLERYVLK
ncbi:MAG: Cof-type HAD-IIB family hydrolase [Brevinema sp.]